MKKNLFSVPNAFKEVTTRLKKFRWKDHRKLFIRSLYFESNLFKGAKKEKKYFDRAIALYNSTGPSYTRLDPLYPQLDPLNTRLDPINPRLDPLYPRLDPLYPQLDKNMERRFIKLPFLNALFMIAKILQAHNWIIPHNILSSIYPVCMFSDNLHHKLNTRKFTEEFFSFIPENSRDIRIV